jgi:hypothetical protein
MNCRHKASTVVKIEDLERIYEKLEKCLQTFEQLLETFEHHLKTTGPDTRLNGFSQQYEDLTHAWMESYENPRAHVVDNPTQGCLTDILFAARLSGFACLHPSIRQLDSVSVLGELIARLRILCCRHVQKEYPSDAQIEQLFRRVAAYYVRQEVPNVLLATKTQDVELDQAVEDLHLLPENLEERAQATKAKTIGERMNIGSLWLAEPTQLIATLIALANRVFYKTSLDLLLLTAYPLADLDTYLPAYDMSIRQAFTTWLADRSRTEWQDSFVQRLHFLAYENWMPMGGREQGYRDEKSRDNVLLPLHILEAQVGLDTSLRLSEITSEKKAGILKIGEQGEEHPMYEWLALCFTIRFSICGK